MRVLPTEESLNIRGPGRPAKYPWDEWLVDGQTIEIQRGEDYDVPTANMRTQIAQAAARRDGVVATHRTKPDGMLVTFRKKLTEEDFDFPREYRRQQQDDDVARALRGESLEP